jgi:DNA-binding XRE family transcriptional regulator
MLRLRTVVARQRLRQSDLAQLVGVDTRTVQQWERPFTAPLIWACSNAAGGETENVFCAGLREVRRSQLSFFATFSVP